MAIEEKQNILIVEDEAINQLYLSSLFKTNYKTFVAGNSAKALEIVNKERIDLILMDISLKGGMNGLQLTQAIRKIDNYSKTPIIAVTGYASKDDLEKSLEAGCNKYITKPFDGIVLTELVSELLNKSHLGE